MASDAMNGNGVCLLVAIGLGLLTLSCSNPSAIEGKVAGVTSDNEYMLYLVKPESLEDVASPFRGIVIDSTSLVPSGSFSFGWEPIGKDTLLLELVLQKKGEKFPLNLINDSPEKSNYFPLVYSGMPVNVVSSIEDFFIDFNFQSISKENRLLLDLSALRVKAYDKFLKGKEWNVHEGTELLEQEEALLNYQKELMQFADTTDEFLSAMVALRWVSPQLDYERTPEFLYSQCEKWQEVSHPWKEALCALGDGQQLPVRVGESFPNAVLPLLSGEEKTYQELKGSALTLVDIWASWCVPCRKENREVLVPLWERYHDRGFQIIAYGLETSDEAWRNAVQKDGAFRWLNASHLEGDETQLMKQLRIQTIPANFLVDSEGRILAKNLHGHSLQSFVQEYLSKNR